MEFCEQEARDRSVVQGTRHNRLPRVRRDRVLGVLQLAALRFRSNDLKELEIVVLRHELAILRRPPLPCGGQPSPAARTLAVLHHHTGDAASLASALGRQAVDVRASRRAAADAA
jgi:hypothetical protein